MRDLSRRAGVRISPERPEDAGRTIFEMFVKDTGEVVTRSPSDVDLRFLVRGRDRRRHPRRVAAERRAAAPGVKLPDFT